MLQKSRGDDRSFYSVKLFADGVKFYQAGRFFAVATVSVGSVNGPCILFSQYRAVRHFRNCFEEWTLHVFQKVDRMVSSAGRAIRLLHVGYREELRAVFREFFSTRNIEIVGESQTMSDAISEALRLKPQIVLLDILLPDGCGLQVCRRIREGAPEIRVLFLTSFDDDDARLASIFAGADGYILKSAGSKALLDAIESVAAGQPTLEAAFIPTLFKHIRANSARPLCAKELSRQEHRILYLVAEGKTNKEIADVLGLSAKTVKNYLSIIFQKLQVTRRSQAAVLFTQLIAK